LSILYEEFISQINVFKVSLGERLSLVILFTVGVITVARAPPSVKALGNALGDYEERVENVVDGNGSEHRSSDNNSYFHIPVSIECFKRVIQVPVDQQNNSTSIDYHGTGQQKGGPSFLRCDGRVLFKGSKASKNEFSYPI
jgi:hypothetical protein